MITKLLSSNVIIKGPSVETELTVTLKSFLLSRFYSLNEDHNQVIFIGSSLSKQNQNITEDRVLDASGTLTTENRDGITSGSRIALSDGLGGGNGDTIEEKSIAKVAHFCCEELLKSSDELTASLYAISHRSLSQALLCSKNQRYESHASMSTVVYEYVEAKGLYRCELANIGDGLIVVLSRDFKVKLMLGAKQWYRGFGVWTPPSLQILSDDCDRGHMLVRKSITLAEGDFVISMTDGIWAELNTILLSQSQSEKQIGIEKKSFEKLLEPLKEIPYASAFSTAKIIVEEAMANHLEKRKDLFKAVQMLELLDMANLSIATVTDLLNYFNVNNMVRESEVLHAVLFGNRFSDGIQYNKNVEIPIEFVIHDLKKRTVGDCSTINVSRVPYRLDEIIRCFIIQPSKRVILAKQLKITIKSEKMLHNSIERLSLEVRQAIPDSILKEVKFKPVFEKSQLLYTKRLLENFFYLTKICTKESNYQNRLNGVADYLENIESISEETLCLLLNMLGDDISPQMNKWQWFFRENQKQIFDDFKTNLLNKIQSKKIQYSNELFVVVASC